MCNLAANIAIMSIPDCPICDKHRGDDPLVAPVIFADDLLHVAHRATGSLGYVFIETQRHVTDVGRLTDLEAAAVGRMTTRVCSRPRRRA